MRLRPYRNEDFFYIREWIEDDRTHAMWSVGKLLFPFTEAELTALLREEEKSMDQSMFTAVLEDGTPAGSFCIRFCPQDNSAYLCRIVVDGKRRGQGLGSQMLKLAFTYAFLVLQADRVRISVFDCNIPARKTYEKAGLKEEAFLSEDFAYQEEKWGRYVLCLEKSEFLKA